MLPLSKKVCLFGPIKGSGFCCDNIQGIYKGIQSRYSNLVPEIGSLPDACACVRMYVRAGLVQCSGTLVVCPASLMLQWQSECESKFKRRSLRVLVYHGPSRTRDAEV